MANKNSKELTICDVAVSIAAIEEQVKVLPDIEKHLRELNGSVSETNVKLAKTEEIATSAKTMASNISNRFNLTLISFIISGIAAITAVIVVLFQILGGVEGG